jgi:BirA family biotin operon repressor/biotin-[acetyl-CoA-carboxylase] ligase
MKQAILKQLPTDHPWRELLQVHEVLPSTNTHAKELAKLGAPSGTTVIARSQTAGRGRMGRTFHSPRDSGLYFSLILRPNCDAQQLMHLTCAVAVAACDAVEQICGLRPDIKWINDLVMNGKKLGGILTELGFGAKGTVDYAVIGIGINCLPETLPEDIKNLACSLSDVTGNADPASLASALLRTLESMSRELLSGRSAIMDRYRRDCITLGRQVQVISPHGSQTGLAEEVNGDGSLTVLLETGQRKKVSAGEVSVRGLWDYI